MYKKKVMQALSASLICSPLLHAMETRALATQQSLPYSTLCPNIVARCAAPAQLATSAKRYSIVRPIPTTTPAQVVGQRTAELNSLKALVAGPFPIPPYTVEVPAFTQMDSVSIQKFINRFGYNLEQRWLQILSAQEISSNVLSERFLTACESIANEIEQFGKLAFLYKILELKSELLLSTNTFEAPKTPLEWVLSLSAASMCRNVRSSFLERDIASLSTPYAAEEYLTTHMISIGSCLARLSGTDEETVINALRSFIKGDSSPYDLETANFLRQAQNAHAFITVRSAARNSTSPATVGDAYTLQELVNPAQSSEILTKLLTLYANQFRRPALTQRFAAQDAHIFDLPAMQFLLQEAPGVATDGTIAVMCQAHGNVMAGSDSVRCALGSTEEPAIMDSYTADLDSGAQTIRIKPIPVLHANDTTVALDQSGALTIAPTLTQEDQYRLAWIFEAIAARYNVPVNITFVFDTKTKRIFPIEVRPLTVSNQTAVTPDPLTIVSNPKDPKGAVYYTPDDPKDWFHYLTAKPVLAEHAQFSNQNLTALIKTGTYEQELSAVATLLLRLQKTINDVTKTTTEKESAIQALVPRNFLERFLCWLDPQPLLLQPELDKLTMLLANIVGAAATDESRDALARRLEFFLTQQPTPGVVMSLSWQTVLDDYNKKMTFLEDCIKPLIEAKKISTQFVTDRSYFLQAFAGITESQTVEQIQSWIVFLDDLLKKPQNTQGELLAALKNSRYAHVYENWKKSKISI